MDRRIVPLIMCGGAGTRLWPASREVRPKQFLPLFGVRSTFQDTMLRVSDATLFERPIVITNTAYRFMVMEQLAEIGLEADVLLEPMRRDSGPAIAAGAAFAQMRDKDAVVLALAADHVVGDTAAFVAACRQGLVAADAGPHRDLRHQARARRHRIRLYQLRRRHFGRGSFGREVRRETRSGNRRRIHQGRLSLEQRQLHVSRLRSARRIPQRRCGERAGRHRCGDQGRTRSRIRHARARRIRIGEGDLDRLCGDGKDRARRGGAGGLRLVRCRLLACGVGTVGQGRRGQRRAGRRRVRGLAQLQCFDRQGAGGAGRGRRSGGGGDPGCRAGVPPEGRQRIEAAGRAS